MHKAPPTAKITKPTVSGIFQRERLFQRLDDSRKRPGVWVSGHAGSGKTTLVASYLDARNLPCLWYSVDQGDADIATFFSYMGRAAEKQGARERKPLPLLTPEYLQGIPTFTKRYFENLCARFNPPFTLVFDNYQDASESSNFHDIIVCGLDAVPDGINVIILSRNEPPPQFVRMRANNKISFVGWDEIRFTLDESREVVRMYGQENLSDEALAEVYRKTEGWMAGLVLFMEGTRRAGIDSTMLGKLVPETIFDYFAGEIFERTDNVTQEFLLKTSLLPSMNPQMAERLTGVRTSADILSRLYKSHYFIEMRTGENPVYHYHPLFREFLLDKTKNLMSSDSRALLLRNAATLLEDSGQIEHAALLLRGAGDWEGLVRLIVVHAQSLIAQGRGRTLEEWLTSIPNEIIGKTPWLLYWMGMCRMPLNFVESREYLQRAFGAFKNEKDAAGIYLSWAGVVNSFVYEGGDFHPLDDWIAEFKKIQLEYPGIPSPEITAHVAVGMFCVLMYRQPHHSDLPIWTKRLEEIVYSSQDISLQTTLSSQLILYHTWWTGDLERAKMILDALESSALAARDIQPLSFIALKAIEGPYYWMKADYEKCMTAVNLGLKTAHDSGIHVWDFMFCAIGAAINMTAEKYEEAAMFVERMRPAPNHPASLMHAGFYYGYASLLSWFRRDFAAASGQAKTSLEITLKLGAPFYSSHVYFVYGLVLLDYGQKEEGLSHLATSKEISRKINCTTSLFLSFLSEAWYFLRKGEESAGLPALSKVMTMGRERHFVNNSMWREDVMSFLCAKALENGIETEYVRELIKKRNLIPPDVTQSNSKSAIRNLHLEGWPWPLKIHTLGKFEIVKDDVPITFSGKVQQKPLALLKAIIAYGGRDVSRQRLIDALWPEADGAQANKSFEAALHRLRRLMDNDKAVLLNQGMVTIDARYCWVDVFAFEAITGQAEEAFQCKLTEDNVKMAIQLTDRIFNSYKGHFLEREAEQSWTIAARERMRKKFLDCIGRSARYLEKAGQHEKAIEYLEKGLERDSTFEEFYQELMTCYHRLGRSAAAKEVYRRCRTVLAAIVGIESSAKTEEIYLQINRKQ